MYSDHTIPQSRKNITLVDINFVTASLAKHCPNLSSVLVPLIIAKSVLVLFAIKNNWHWITFFELHNHSRRWMCPVARNIVEPTVQESEELS